MPEAGDPLSEGKIIEMLENERAKNQDDKPARLMYQMVQQSFQTGTLDKMDVFTLISDSVQLTPAMDDWLSNAETAVQKVADELD